jgi:DNA-binding CsgD family transcriptional regulator
MSLIQEILQINLHGRHVARTYHLDQDVIRAVKEIAMQHMWSEEALVESLLRFAISQTWAFEDYSRLWENLTMREQEVAALVCLDYSNQEIGCRLSISPETVKTHLYKALSKLRLKHRKDLAQALANWDFSSWIS